MAGSGTDTAVVQRDGGLALTSIASPAPPKQTAKSCPFKRLLR